MKINARSIMVATTLVLGLAAIGYSGPQGRQSDESIIGNKGVVHLTKTVKARDISIPPGMYVVQHVEDGQEHVLVFKQLSMEGANQKHVFMPRKDDPGIEIARFKCTVEPVTRKWGRTTLILHKNAAGDREVSEVQIIGESFKHLL